MDKLFSDVRLIISQARLVAAKSINSLQTLSCFLIGRRIIEEEQKGKKRAEYGKETIHKLANELKKEFGRGYSQRNLEMMRKFFLCYEERFSIPQTLSAESDLENSLARISQTLSAKFPLSWSHYIFLISISGSDERNFYELEAISENWSLRELKRQFNSSLFERLALSRDKAGVKRLSTKGQLAESYSEVIRNPYVLEFLGLNENKKYSESELETAIIDKLEHFLLELGKGFLFEARQKRFTFDDEHFYVDLVFYNRLLRCYVLIDLKIGSLKHQDLGQMQMYVNYFDRYVKLPEEEPTIGIVLCKKKNDSLVKITLPENANIHAAKYLTYLPDKVSLKKQLEEAQREWEQNHETEI
ncbi:MAG: hypothetical protein PWR01_2532 [Clostridiales bacterium]|nr:hypothetical protein [Clostridiales bacterium]MDN5281459.1 hypothetical protein [Candidatus Ozemobacter sp.]